MTVFPFRPGVFARPWSCIHPTFLLFGRQNFRLWKHHVVEQDHRAVKRLTRPMLGFKTFEAAQATLVGIELMHMIKKK
jgi:transposase-like protein